MVSVIVPIYNVEKYLRQCLDSLIKQSYADLQIILVNDGSPDLCREICEEYCKKDKRFELVNKENAGLGFARNTGLDYVKGDYVVFVDSDDYFDERLIQALVDEREKYNADTCIGCYLKVSDEGVMVKTYNQKEAFYEEEDVLNKLLPSMIASSPKGGDAIPVSSCNLMYSVKIIKENNLKFCSEREYTSEDLFFNLEYFRYAKRVKLISEPLYFYRTNFTSLSYRYRADRFEMKKKIYIEACKRLKRMGIYDNSKLRLMKYYFLGLKMCVRQETPQMSGKSKKQCLERIKEVCADNLLLDICKEYPVKELGKKQQLFLFLVRKNMSRTLLFLGQRGFLN